MTMMMFNPLFLLSATITTFLLTPTTAMNGGRSMIETTNGWKAIEVITEGDEKDGYVVDTKMDGMGAFLASANELRIQVNHELSGTDATISEINMDKELVRQAIVQVIQGDDDDERLPHFVTSVHRAWDRWTDEGDSTDPKWNTKADFCRFCSSQSFEVHTFGQDRGFVDRLYITGEECDDGRVFVLDSTTRDLYQLSGVTSGPQNGLGFEGMPFDSIENAALIDTGEKDHVAFLLSADGGTHTLMLYVGKKGMDADGNPSNTFLARNGLLHGEWFYLDTIGKFVTDPSNLLRGPKFEDIDTNPNNPTQVVLAESSSGIFILDFNLVMDGNGLNGENSYFSMRKIADTADAAYQYPDNVDWTTNDLIFVNKDHDEGGIWYMTPQGERKTQVGTTKADGESTGILDLSALLDYPPASVVITTNHGTPSSMTLLLNPNLIDVIVDQEEVVTPAPAVEEEEDEEKAVDDHDHDDDDGGCPANDSNHGVVVLQAENAVKVDGYIATLGGGYCGDGYVIFDQATESAGITFLTHLASAVDYHVTVRYANGDEEDRPGALFVNGVNQNMMFDFVNTGGWSKWGTETVKLSLKEVGGINFSIWWSNGGARPSIDWMMIIQEISPPTPQKHKFVRSSGDTPDDGEGPTDYSMATTTGDGNILSWDEDSFEMGEMEEFSASAATTAISALLPRCIFAAVTMIIIM